MRVYVNAPLPCEDKVRTLMVFATPNGNTIEQTLGSKMAEGRDWHFDIQHIAAQIRRFREITPTEPTILAVVQAPKQSWPTYRQEYVDANQRVKSLVEQLAKEVAATRIILSCHSGGGSFVFGFIESADTIPTSITRIVLLDANYAYADDKQHGDKLLNWINEEKTRRLITIAYDDREITLNGKKVVSLTGGTFRASQRMIDRFSRDVQLTDERVGPFVHRHGLNGQIEFFIHPNPENKILHTALVGEMNGLLLGLTLGTPQEPTWGTFGGPRAYTRWVQKAPSQEIAGIRSANAPAFAERRPTLSLPPRPADAPTGSQFARQIDGQDRGEREAAIQKEILRGNVPEFLRSLVPIALEAADAQGNKHTAT